MSRLAERVATVDSMAAAFSSVLCDSYLKWLPTKVASTVHELMPIEMVGMYQPASYELMGYFEDMANKMILYETHKSRQPSDGHPVIDYQSKDFFESGKLKETKIGIRSLANRFTGSQATATYEGLDATQQSYRKFTEKVGRRSLQELDSIQLQDLDFSTENSRKLDLVKMRKMNRDFFDETKTSLPSKGSVDRRNLNSSVDSISKFR